MEIIHLILGKANPARMNGVNKVVHELATQQQQAGMAVEVWGFTAHMVHNYPERVYKTRLFEASPNPFRVGQSWKEAMLARRGEVIVQLHGGFVPRFYAAARFLQQHHIPYLITPHGNYNWHALQRNFFQKKLYFRLFESRLLAGAGAVHMLGQSEVDGLQRLYPNQKSVMVPYGYNAMPERITHDTGTFTVGFCGRLDIDHKGIDRLIEGFAEFAKTVPSARLWLIGDGPDRQPLEDLANRLDLGDSVKFWGGQYGSDKFELLYGCSVFVHASRYEGLPVSVLEAASLGIPCLVSEATNLANEIRTYEAGWVAGEGTPPEVTDGLNRLYAQWLIDGLRPLGQNARRMVQEEFNWPRQLDRLNQLYEKVMSECVNE
ncbi:glycosyltransferase [Rudanella paleaurantiibacter]|uniref:Glycosyltransferase n=1 Tax=Rudanella paleaurantiibacter TaxID=2614655 RepID=A0A7J5TUJ7_9BACT|nr:glycosyltransferase [Rudanella paleaurantiibacter]KAB7727661.1 glycosyltransferase [Rudanella paleaurantiibacter]